MNPSRVFILRPVGTSLLMAAILTLGLFAYRFLPVSALPEVDYPTIEVTTFYPGASPDVMASSITAPLEVQLGQMPGLDRMASTSSAGASVITLQFSLALSLDVAEQEVQAAINAAGNLLPNDLPAPPIYAKVNPADPPVLTLALTSKTLPLTTVENLADTRLATRISQLPGVGLVSISGGNRPAVRIRADAKKLAAFGLNLDDLRTIVATANLNAPKGSLDGPAQSYAINANDQITRPAQYRDLVIAYRNGAPVRLGDVAKVVEGAENTRLAAWMDRTPAVLLNIRRQPGANVIAVVDGIKALLPSLSAGLPAAVRVTPLTDRTVTIRASVRDVGSELVLAVLLVVAVIFIFLRSPSATVIPSLSVPLSLVGTLAVMDLLGFSLNNLSLMALTIASGFVVDDAIVMIENISRHIEAGMPPLAAALEGSRQIGFTILSLTVSLVAVLIPLLFMPDVVGRLFREFAVTLAVTIMISAVVALTLVPMLCAKLLRRREARELSGLARLSGAAFERLSGFYGRLLSRVLNHQPLVLALAGASVVLTVLLYVVIPKGFFPVQDTGLIQGISEASPGISFSAMARRQQRLADAILKDRDVASLSSFIGVDGTNLTPNTGRFLINLVAHDRRALSAEAISRRLEKETAGVAGIAVYLQPVQDLTVASTVSRSQYQFALEDADPAEFARWVPKLLSRLRQMPEITTVASSYEANAPAVTVDIDRATAARFGITPATVDNALYDAFGQRIISTIFTQSNQYRVILDADPARATSLSSLGAIYIPSATASGGEVPLSAIAHIETGRAPFEIDHLQQFPATTVSFNLAPGASLGTAVAAIRAAEYKLGVPPGMITRFEGAALAFEKALGSELLLILAAIVTVYIVLGILYESYIHPLTILSTLPSAGVGALLALMIAGRDLSVVAVIGIILLIGIVKKNAIMMVDFAIEAERRQGKLPRAAIEEAALLRFRPILMTTMAALFGALPLMLGTGTGSELRQPLGITIIGGLVVSQLLTLFTTPVIYLAFARLAARLRAGRHPAASEGAAE